jgi:hypothetical protein
MTNEKPYSRAENERLHITIRRRLSGGVLGQLIPQPVARDHSCVELKNTPTFVPVFVKDLQPFAGTSYLTLNIFCGKTYQ